MPLPKREVLSALFESYINIRKENWKFETGEAMTLPESAVPAYKVRTCITLLKKMDEAQSMNDWINIIYDLDEAERFESKNLSAKKFLGLAKFFVGKPLLFLTIHASISYIIDQIYEEPEFAKEKERLLLQKSELEKSIHDDESHEVSKDIINQKKEKLADCGYKIDVLNSSREFVHSYFLDILKEQDKKVLELNEKSFTDFEKHAISMTRPLSIVRKLVVNSNNLLSISPKESISSTALLTKQLCELPITNEKEAKIKEVNSEETDKQDVSTKKPASPDLLFKETFKKKIEQEGEHASQHQSTRQRRGRRYNLRYE